MAIIGYDIEVNGAIIDHVDGDVLAYVLPGRQLDEEITVRVRAINEIGPGEWSTPVTTVAGPAPVMNLQSALASTVAGVLIGTQDGAWWWRGPGVDPVQVAETAGVSCYVSWDPQQPATAWIAEANGNRVWETLNNGDSWVEWATQRSSFQPIAVARSGGQRVLLSVNVNSTLMYRSLDLANWELTTSPHGDAGGHAAYADTVDGTTVVSAGQAAGNTPRMAWSNDGVSWVSELIPNGSGSCGAASQIASGIRFASIWEWYGPGSLFRRSGTTWTRVLGPSSGWSYSMVVQLPSGRLVAFQVASFSSNSPAPIYSDDEGLTWTSSGAISGHGGEVPRGIAWDGARHVAIACFSDGLVLESSDGADWTVAGSLPVTNVGLPYPAVRETFAFTVGAGNGNLSLVNPGGGAGYVVNVDASTYAGVQAYGEDVWFRVDVSWNEFTVDGSSESWNGLHMTATGDNGASLYDAVFGNPMSYLSLVRIDPPIPGTPFNVPAGTATFYVRGSDLWHFDVASSAGISFTVTGSWQAIHAN